ncbi:MAG: hypothetical protein GY847_03250 [Proteobacteria bacterium]|nr:hypothetical protein [Pseudomonadota bacterium]
MRRPYKCEEGADGVYGYDGGPGVGGVAGDGVEGGGFAGSAFAGDEYAPRSGEV